MARFIVAIPRQETGPVVDQSIDILPTDITFVASTVVAEETVDGFCSRPGNLFCEDWEGAYPPPNWSWNATKWDCDTGTSGKACFVSPGYNSDTAMRFELEASPEQNTAFPDRSFTANRTVYARWFAKFSAGYVFKSSTQSGQKHAYLVATASGEWEWRVMVGITAFDGSNREDGLFYVDWHTHEQVQEATTRILADTWYEVELAVRMSDQESPANGFIKLWVNGNLEVNLTDMIPNKRLGTSSINQDEMNTMRLSGYYGGADENHPLQYIFYDRIEVSTSQ